MVAVMLMSVALIAILSVAAYTLAVYALPFMLGLTAAQFAYQTGSGLIGAGLVGLVTAGAAYGILALLFDTLRPPILRLIVALVFAAPSSGQNSVELLSFAPLSRLTRNIGRVGISKVEVGRILWQLSVTPPWDTFAVYLHQAESTRRHQATLGDLPIG